MLNSFCFEVKSDVNVMVVQRTSAAMKAKFTRFGRRTSVCRGGYRVISNRSSGFCPLDHVRFASKAYLERSQSGAADVSRQSWQPQANTLSERAIARARH